MDCHQFVAFGRPSAPIQSSAASYRSWRTSVGCRRDDAPNHPRSDRGGRAAARASGARRIVRAYCEEIGIAYHETSIVQSYREILGFLHEIGAPLRAAGAAVG